MKNTQAVVTTEVDSEAGGVEVVDVLDYSDLRSKRAFTMEFYLTALKDKELIKDSGLNPDLPENAHLKAGRPDFSDIFARTKALCASEGITKVSCVCVYINFVDLSFLLSNLFL
jgi:hypothetical protein